MTRLIDADDLKKHYAWWEDDKQKLFDSIVDRQPTIDAVPVRHGKWIDRNGAIVASFWERYECSECGVMSGNNKYCPNCGARMDEE